MSEQLVLGVPTFRRPERLGQALATLREQAREVAADPGAGVEVELLVVDNDPGASAREVASRYGVRYVVEPRPGLSAVRNAVLDAVEGADLLVFLDDDEVPGPGWLAALLRTWRTTGADAVAGRVSTELPHDADAWLRAAYRRPTRRPGQTMAAAATNNLLLDLATVRRLGLRFDERFGLVGGEDTMFTSQLVRGGGVIQWCEEAHVVESVDSSRLSRRWVLMRSYRSGNTHALVQRALANGPGSRTLLARQLLGGLARVGVGGLRTLLARLRRDPAARAAAERSAWRGAGLVTGALGHGYREYAHRRAAGPGSGEPA